MEYLKFKDYYNENTPYLKLLGIVLEDVGEGFSVGRMVTDGLGNLNETVHGGAIFSFADSICGAAAKSMGSATTTLEGKINYISPGNLGGGDLICSAKVVHCGRKTVVVQCDISQEERLVATCLFTMFRFDRPAM